MGRMVVCSWEGRSLTIDEALLLRNQRASATLHFYCLECGERIRAHKAGTTGQGAHFEHLVRNPLCSGGSGSPRFSTNQKPLEHLPKFAQSSVSILPHGIPKIKGRQDYSPIESFLPPACGFREFRSTLCLGLDIAWFGGSKGNPDSQFDCVVAAVVGPDSKATRINIQRVPLIGRDLDATLTANAIGQVIDRLSQDVESVVLAIDAPLLSTQVIPPGRQRAWRASDRALGDARQTIDQFVGGSHGWHPTVQPGAPLAPRVIQLIKSLESQHGFTLWSGESERHERLVIEVFPSEAIWALKRLGGYADHQNADVIRSYKKLKGMLLNESEVRNLVRSVLAPVGRIIDFEEDWQLLLESALSWMIADPTWGEGAFFRGGKLLDDVIDSLLCLAVSVGYAKGESHVFFSEQNFNDGHIIGPGRFE
jgi:predicted RNase H-like nuclease